MTSGGLAPPARFERATPGLGVLPVGFRLVLCPCAVYAFPTGVFRPASLFPSRPPSWLSAWLSKIQAASTAYGNPQPGPIGIMLLRPRGRRAYRVWSLSASGRTSWRRLWMRPKTGITNFRSLDRPQRLPITSGEANKARGPPRPIGRPPRPGAPDSGTAATGRKTKPGTGRLNGELATNFFCQKNRSHVPALTTSVRRPAIISPNSNFLSIRQLSFSAGGPTQFYSGWIRRRTDAD